MREGLSNLVTNAAKYGSTGSRIRAKLVAEEHRVALSVENKDVRFRPWRLRRCSSRCVAAQSQPPEHASLGLGLFIVREIARARGGDVHASSQEGKTVFTMTLRSG